MISVIYAKNVYARRLKIALLIFAIAISTGVVGYMSIEQHNFREALYMTIITLSTVGFGEVEPLSVKGQYFTIGLIVFNIAAFTYAIGVITAFFLDGEFNKFYKFNKMHNKIQNLSNHVIVCGFGRLGRSICKELKSSKIDFLVVEKNPDKIEMLKELGYLYRQGDATEDSIYQQLQISKAKALVTTVSIDSTNVFVTLATRELNKDITIISRVKDSANESKLRLAGANHTILPEEIGGKHMATLITQPALLRFNSIMNNSSSELFCVEEIDVDKLRKQGKAPQMNTGQIKTEFGMTVLAISDKAGKFTINPTENITLSEVSIMVIFGTTNQIRKFEKTMA